MNTKSRNRGQSSSGEDSTACFPSFRTPTTVLRPPSTLHPPPSTLHRPLSTVHCLLFTLLLGAGTAYGQLSTDGNIIRRYRENGTNYYAHIFTNSGTLNLSGFSGSTNVQYLIVAGGGGGGGGTFTGSGGGAGGVRLGSASMTASAYTITVGDGGVGCPINAGAPWSGTNGYPSSINGVGVTVNATGGGRGNTINMGGPGNGGSGGGGHYSGTYGSAVGGGELGNNGNYTGANPGCGGGGARTAGGASSGSNGGVGGGGTNLSFSGVPVVYASGGDGAPTIGGGWGTYFQGADGAPNTGNGGGGSCNNYNLAQTKNGGKGGSGIVIVRYVDSAAFSATVTVTSATAVWPFQVGAFTISRPDDATTNAEMTVNYTLTGTATSGVDYAAAPATNNLNIVPLPGYVKFGVGETSIVVNLYPLYNPPFFAKTATMTLNVDNSPAADINFTAWSAGAVSASGGVLTNYNENGTNFIARIFTNVVGSTDFTLTTGGTVQYMAVAGGGGGSGGWESGGGGAGGVRFGTLMLPAGTYPITVGDGGAGYNQVGGPANGGMSTIGGSNGIVVVRSLGGGCGGSSSGTAKGQDGGSGGGGVWGSTYGNPVGGVGEVGNNGGAQTSPGGGGGGAGSVGRTSNNSGVGTNAGGDGTNLTFRAGTPVTYAAGGVGRGRDGVDGANAAANTGNGGNGGGGGPAYKGGNGGSGIVIVRYDSGTPVVQNRPVTDVTVNSATFNGFLVSTGFTPTAFCVLWGMQNGGAAFQAWAHTNWFVDGPPPAWTNNMLFSTNTVAMGETLVSDSTYYYAFAALNGFPTTPAKDFITGLVTVQATTNSAQYFPRSNGQFMICRPATCTNEALTVYFTLNGTATNGVQYSPVASNAIISAGATSTVVNVVPLYGSSGTAILTLVSGYNYPIGAPNSETVTIQPPVIPPVVYVVSSGSAPAEPYGTWATAANDIQTAVTFASAHLADVNTVLVTNGTYNITAQITVNAAIAVRSFGNGVYGGLSNAASTIVRPSSGSLYLLNITGNATIDGLTIRDSGPGAKGVIMSAGWVQNCIIRNNGHVDNTDGIGVTMTGGTVSNCVISYNSGGAGGGSRGAPVWIGANSSIVNSWITDNTAYNGSGGGVLMDNATAVLRNCVVARNRASNGAGGGVYISAGTIESCTIVGNNASGSGGGIYRSGSTAGTVRNCIVVSNTSGDAYKNSYSGTSGWTCNDTTLPDVAGTGCTSADPLFRNYAEGNYQLSAGSPCIDTGTNQTWMVAGVKDLGGNERKQDGDNNGIAITDMGAYEYNTTLSCDFLASPRGLIASPTTYQAFGLTPFTVQFTGWADGTNLTGLVYHWDFDNDGNYEQEGLNLTNVSYTYNTAGVYNPRLQVNNSTAEVAEKIKSAYVSAGMTHYVRTNSPGAAYPYTSWATAASNNIQAAINAATLNGSQVVISNGTYTTASALTIGMPLAVRSFQGGLSGASNTVVQGGVAAHFTVSSPYAELEGLTIRQGFKIVTISAGLVRNCIIRDGSTDNIDGIGVYMTGGTVSNCVVTSNTGGGGGGSYGSAVYISSGSILNSWITDNTAWNGSGGGVIMAGASAVLRNCLVARNYARTGVGGGVYITAGTVESCTIVTNSSGSASGGGGIYRNGSTAGTVLNCIVYNNTAPNHGTYKNSNSGISGWTYNDTTLPDVAGTGCITGAPAFQNEAAGDYRLTKGSPCIDRGTNQTWMAGATELSGAKRMLYGGAVGTFSHPVVDMGAYELYIPPFGTVILMR